MDTFATLLNVAALLLLVAGVSAIAGMLYLLLAGYAFHQPTRLRVHPFDVVQKDGVTKGTAEPVARQVVAAIRGLLRGLACDLVSTTPSPRSARLFKPMPPPRCAVASPLLVGVPYLRVDLTGPRDLLSGLVFGGYAMSGTVRFGEKDVELLACAECEGDAPAREVGPWAARGATLAEAVEALSCAVVFDVWLAADQSLDSLGPDGVKALAVAIEQHRQAGFSHHAGWNARRPGLTKAVDELQEFAGSDATAPALYACLGVLHEALGNAAKSGAAFDALKVLDPEHPLVPGGAP